MFVDGKKIARKIKANIKKEMKERGAKKKMAIVYVGQNKVIDKFVNLKKNFGKDVGIPVQVFRFEKNITEKDLAKNVKKICKEFDGVVIQLPLPSHIDKKTILNIVPKGKDIDILSDKKYAEFKKGDMSRLPPVAGAIFEILSFYDIDLENKKVAVVGDGVLVGRPTFDLFVLMGLNPILVNKETKNSKDIIKSADVLVCGVGSPSFIKNSHIKNDVILFDAGSSSEGGVVVGDISKDCIKKASIFSAVPGGIGPITIAILFRNLLYN